MAIQNRRGNFVDFDPYKMLSGEFAYTLDTEELYYCISPGNVKRCATKEDVIEILETSQDAYNGLQQLLTELEDETVATGILNDISTLLDDVALNKSNIVSNTQDIVNLDNKVNTHLADYNSHLADYNSHLAESANRWIEESGSNENGSYIKFGDGTMECWHNMTSNSTLTTTAGSMFSTESNTWVYPAQFVRTRPSVTRDLNSVLPNAWAGIGNSGTTSASCSIRGYSYMKGSDNYIPEFSLRAIGRWK